MIRTIVSMPEELKVWLDEESESRGQTMTALVRDILEEYRSTHPRSDIAYGVALKKTSALIDPIDGASYQEQVRGGW